MTLFDKIFKDKNGKVVIAQFPNLPIIMYFVAIGMSKITNGTLSNFFEVLSVISLFIFASLELFQGVNYIRRALGFFVLVFIAISLLR